MMEQSQDNTQAAHIQAADAGQDEATPLSVGRQLREARERLGWSVDDVVGQIKLSPRQVRALEADDFESLPEIAFLRGFVRSYAKALKLDAQPLLDALPGGQPAADAGRTKVETPFPVVPSQQTQNMRLLAGALAIALLIAGFAAWQAYAPQPAPQDEAASLEQSPPVETAVALPEQAEIVPASGVTASAAPAESAVPAASAVQQTASAVEAAVKASAVAQPAPATRPAPATKPEPATKTAPEVRPAPASKPAVDGKPAASPGKLRLVFDKDSWTEVRDKSGKTVARGLYKAGQELNLDGEAPFSLLVGHAASAHLYYRGRAVDMTPHIGASSEVARLTLE